MCVAREVGRELKAYKDKRDTVLELRRKRAEAKMYNEVIRSFLSSTSACIPPAMPRVDGLQQSIVYRIVNDPVASFLFLPVENVMCL